MMALMNRKRKGFTLVELMVVVVIIGVLVAIAIPIYNTVTARAAAGAHEANVRILRGAGSMYWADNPDAGAQTGLGETDLGEYVDDWPTVPSGLAADHEAANWGGYAVDIDTNGNVTVTDE